MSSESIAALRKSYGEDLAKIADEHLQHDLLQSDRDTLKAAAGRLSSFAATGAGAGLALGLLLAFRVRSTRTKTFQAFRAMERPTHVQFAGGRTEPIPDIAPLMKPSTLGDIAAYTFFSAGGVFLGGELGAISGSYGASRSISKDPEARARIERAFRRFRADVLRKEAEALERGQGSVGF